MKQRSTTTSGNGVHLGTWLGGAALGALAMYFSDPERGRRRRALTRDKLHSAVTQSNHAVSVAARDLGNRMQGMRARAEHMARKRRPSHVDDAVLAGRVRARLGRVTVHSHPLKVEVQAGHVHLSGPVLASEKETLLRAVRQVPGVHEMTDALTAYQSADGVPSLQGGEERVQERALRGNHGNWPPGLRALASAGAGMLALYGLRRRGAAGTLIGTAGIGLLARSLSNRPLVGNGAGRHAIRFNKTIHIAAPPEKVFDMWSDYKHFPYFMSQVREVRDLGNGRSHWTVQGPAGMLVEWDAQLTASERPHHLAWRTEEGTAVQHAGEVRLEEESSGTRVTVHLAYHPPAGMLGHRIAALLGRNPKRQMDEDLMRMKSYIESGIVPHDAAQPMPPLGVRQTAQSANQPDAY